MPRNYPTRVLWGDQHLRPSPHGFGPQHRCRLGHTEVIYESTYPHKVVGNNISQLRIAQGQR